MTGTTQTARPTDGATPPADSPETADRQPLRLADCTLRLADGDEVVVAIRDLPAGTRLTGADGADRATGTGSADGAEVADRTDGTLVVRSDVPRGHKLAVRDVPAGGTVHKYGQSIGLATVPVVAGDHVHVHNLGMDAGAAEHELATVHTELPAPTLPLRTFDGYVRADGRVGTRNYVAVLTSVNCSAATARMIADRVTPLLVDYPHVDGVVALTHQSGCGMIPTSTGGSMFQRTLRGFAAHPNVSGLLVLGLGCEMVQVQSITDTLPVATDTLVESLTIQEQGGIRATVEAGVAAVLAMLPSLEARRRQPVPISELVLGLNCGGSDGYSGITANPALGYASDLLVAAGATSVLAETPEVYGAEHLLTRRAVTEEVAQTLLDRIAWWERYAEDGEGSLDNNPSPGNKAGGLTTILEKSLGAVAKAGHADLSAVYQYAEPMTTRGLGFMDTPGYDPVSVTGLVAGGATVVCFTTGRGSVLGTRPAPTIKLATNTEMYERMSDDMDLNCGRIVDGTSTLAEVGLEIFEQIIAVASGQTTASEELGLGQDEFVPWQLGTVT